MSAPSRRVLVAAIVAAGMAASVAQAAARTFVVVSSADAGAGSLREAIEAANREPGSRIEVRGLLAPIVVASALPAITGAGTVLDAGGATLRQGEGCARPDGRRGCSGIVVRGEGVVVMGLRVGGFTFDGISVIGPGAKDVRLADVHAFDNLDDGIGVTAGAGPVRIEASVMMGNGFRTKGKGLLVFDDAVAEIRDSVVVGNRDGITVTRGARLAAFDTFVVASFDKGFGVSAASASAERVFVAASGDGRSFAERGPNADGVRVTRGGRLSLADSIVAGSGDCGVVALENSRVLIDGGRIEASRGAPWLATKGASVKRRRLGATAPVRPEVAVRPPDAAR